VHRRIWRVAEATVEDALSDLSAQEAAQLIRLLGRVKKTLVEDEDVDRPARNGAANGKAARNGRHLGSAAP
jgi:hypothetical protein